MFLPRIKSHKHDLFPWITFILICVILSGTVGCASWTIGAEKNVVRNGIKFDTFREVDSGKKLGILAEDMVIDGWPVKRDFVVFHSSWELDELHLSSDYERNGVFMPAGTRVFPNQHGNPGVVCFSRDVEVQGYVSRGNASGGYMTAFYPNGRLHWFYPRDPVVVDGIACTDSLFEALYLYPDGSLRQCKLDKAITISGKQYSSGRVIRFDQMGKALGTK